MDFFSAMRGIFPEVVLLQAGPLGDIRMLDAATQCAGLGVIGAEVSGNALSSPPRRASLKRSR